jgi:hypothetical protein
VFGQASLNESLVREQVGLERDEGELYLHIPHIHLLTHRLLLRVRTLHSLVELGVEVREEGGLGDLFPQIAEHSEVARPEFVDDGVEHDLKDLGILGRRGVGVLLLCWLTILHKVKLLVSLSIALEHLPSLDHLVQQSHFESEVLSVKESFVLVVPQSLQHQFATGEDVAFDVQFDVDAHQPEVDHSGVQLEHPGDDSVELLGGLAETEEVEVLFPEGDVVSEFAAGSVIEVDDSAL